MEKSRTKISRKIKDLINNLNKIQIMVFTKNKDMKVSKAVIIFLLQQFFKVICHKTFFLQRFLHNLQILKNLNLKPQKIHFLPI